MGVKGTVRLWEPNGKGSRTSILGCAVRRLAKLRGLRFV